MCVCVYVCVCVCVYLQGIAIGVCQISGNKERLNEAIDPLPLYY